MEEPLSCRLLDVCIVVGVPENVVQSIKTHQLWDGTSLYRRELTSSVLMALSPPLGKSCALVQDAEPGKEGKTLQDGNLEGQKNGESPQATMVGLGKSCALVQDAEPGKEGKTLQDGNLEGQNNGESPQGTMAELEDDVAKLEVSMDQVPQPCNYLRKMEVESTDNSSENSKESIASESSSSLFLNRKSYSAESVGGWNPDQSDQNSVFWSLDLDGLPQLCMPDGTYLSPIRPRASIHTLVLTDVAGEKSYAVVLTCHRPLVCDQPELDGSQKSSERRQIAFLPTCICLLSKAPYYTALKDCLSCLQQELEEHNHEMDDMGKFEEVVREFAARLSLVPMPPPGPLHLCLKMGSLDILLPSASGPSEPIIDFDLNIPFLCLKPSDLLMVIVSLLTEQHMVLLSNTCALLTPVAEALLASLHPLVWRNTYVPLLSRGMLDFLEAPTVFLMGCLRCHAPEICKIKGLVIVDLDSGVVSSPVDEDPVPNPPEAATEEFLFGARDMRLSEEVAALEIPTPLNLAAERRLRHARRSHLNEYLKKLCFNFLLAIFRDVTDHLNYEHRVFNSDEFLRTRQPQELQFYKKVLATDMFHCFLRDRLERKVDAFSCMDRGSTVLLTSPRSDPHHNTRFRQTYPDGMSSKLMTQDTADPHNSRRSLIFSSYSLDSESDKGCPTPILLDMTNDSKGLDPYVHTVRLPPLPKNPLAVEEIVVYADELSSTLSETLNSASSQACGLRAACHYLRGCLFLARGYIHDALEDFHSISKTDSSVLPAEQACQLLSHLPSDLLEEIRQDPKLRWLVSDVVPFDLEPLPPTPEVDFFRSFSLPSQPLDSSAFGKSMQQVGIIKNYGDSQRLFKILGKGLSYHYDHNNIVGFQLASTSVYGEQFLHAEFTVN
uniref:DENN domain-containing protein 3-like n=1 Tax=Myxine glutinosa TaxID=7769 RepID=UPI00358E045F